MNHSTERGVGISAYRHPEPSLYPFDRVGRRDLSVSSSRALASSIRQGEGVGTSVYGHCEPGLIRSSRPGEATHVRSTLIVSLAYQFTRQSVGISAKSSLREVRWQSNLLRRHPEPLHHSLVKARKSEYQFTNLALYSTCVAMRGVEGSLPVALGPASKPAETGLRPNRR